MIERMMLVFCLRHRSKRVQKKKKKECREKQDSQENRGLPSGALETEGRGERECGSRSHLRVGIPNKSHLK